MAASLALDLQYHVLLWGSVRGGVVVFQWPNALLEGGGGVMGGNGGGGGGGDNDGGDHGSAVYTSETNDQGKEQHADGITPTHPAITPPSKIMTPPHTIMLPILAAHPRAHGTSSVGFVGVLDGVSGSAEIITGGSDGCLRRWRCVWVVVVLLWE